MLPVIRNDGAATTVCGPAVAFSSRVTSHVHIIPERHRQDVVGDGVRVPLAPKRRLSSSASVTSRRPSCLLPCALEYEIGPFGCARVLQNQHHLMISSRTKKLPADQCCHYSRNSLETIITPLMVFTASRESDGKQK